MLAVGGDGGDAEVSVGGRVAVPRKMLGGGQHDAAAVGLGSFDEGFHVSRHHLRVLAERADVDDGIVGIIVDIGIGVENPVDTERTRLPRCNFALITR